MITKLRENYPDRVDEEALLIQATIPGNLREEVLFSKQQANAFEGVNTRQDGEARVG